ncbi:hypothetical protein HU200_026773 [Digitaria exilis]|uniref:Uncharacterized protein n=1 Tax=Digitaria exilis TaxID=1010633 RepID=A0A835EU45_9POAL|nr:hypothetical protein HU200_026773 [Digitaria exilis]
MSKKTESGKLGRWLGAPMRALSRACDLYVRRMTACAGRMPTHAAAYGGGRFPMQAAAFSSPSRRGEHGDDEDVIALIRALSQRQQATASVVVPARSRSVAVGRIDEDAPCEFGADDVVGVGIGVGGPAVRRARSVAVGRAGRLGARAGKKQLAGGGVVRG